MGTLPRLPWPIVSEEWIRESLLAQREWVRALALRLVDDPGAADDLSQDTLVAALEKPPTRVRWGDERTLRAWLASVVRNLALKRSRSESNRRARETETARRGTVRSAEDVVQEAALHRRVVEAVMELDSKYRTPLLLRYYDGRDASAIGHELGLAPAAVRKRLSRGLERLRARLDAESDGDRGAWITALGPLFRRAATKTPSPIGVLAMSTFAKLATTTAAVILGIALWPRDGEESDAASAGAVDPHDRQVLEGVPRGEVNPVVESSPELEAPRPAERAVAAEPRATRDPRLLVRVVAKEDGAPVPGARVKAYDPDRPSGIRVVRESAGGIHECLMSDADGLVTFDVPVGVALQGRVAGHEIGRGDTSFDIEPFEEGEEREVVVELPAGVVVAYHGRLLDRETEQPVAGAEIRMGGGGWPDPDWGPGGEVVATTDAGGNFELQWRSWTRTNAQVRAEGYGPTLVEATNVQDDPESPEVVYVSRAAELRGRIVGPTDEGLSAVAVSVSAWSWDLVGQARTYETLVQYDWSTTTSVDGSFSLAELPASVELELHLRQGRVELLSERTVFRLEAGEVREETFRTDAGHRVEGRFLGPDGDPLARRALALSPAESEGDETYFTMYPKPTHHVRTDDEGRFVFRDVAAGEWWIGPPYVSQTRARRPDIDFPALAHRITVPTTGEVIVEARRPLLIEGTVVDPRGYGVAGAQVSAHSVELRNAGVDAWTDESGHFALGPLAGGEFDVSVFSGKAFASTGETRARAGTKGVVIALLDAGSFRAISVDAVTGAPVAARWALSSDPPLDVSMRAGRLAAEYAPWGLVPGTYHVVGISADGRIGVLRGIDVRAGVEVDDLRVELAAGATLVVRNSGSAEKVYLYLVNDGIKVGWLRLEAAESQEIVVPPGKTTLVQYGESREALGEVANVEVDAGLEREVVLRVDDG